MPLVVVFDIARKTERFTNVWNTGVDGVSRSEQLSLFDVNVDPQDGDIQQYSPGGTLGTQNKEIDDTNIIGNIPKFRTFWMYEENQNQKEIILAKPLAFDRVWKYTIPLEELFGVRLTSHKTNICSKDEVTLWKPRCPKGFVALGVYPVKTKKNSPYLVY